MNEIPVTKLAHSMFYRDVTEYRSMRYSSAMKLLLSMMILVYPLQLASAQTSDMQRCDEEICNVTITKEGFVPKTLIVKIGTTVVWTNTDDSRHTVTSGSPGELTAPLKSLLLDKGSVYKFTFSFAGSYKGSYKYFDQVTKTMRGEIIVEPETKAKEKTEPEVPETNTVKIDFNDPKSGVKNISFPHGSIKSIVMDPSIPALFITLQVGAVSNLEITLDRNLIDAKSNGKDGSFVVLVNGKEGFFDEMLTTPTERTLRIVVPIQATTVEIRGTISLSIHVALVVSEVEEVIAEHKSRGIIVSDAESKLNEAKEAVDNGKYAEAERLAEEAKTIANNTGTAALIAMKALAEAEKLIKQRSDQGLDVSSAEQVLGLAKQEYTNGNYDKAFSLAQQTREIAMEVTKSDISTSGVEGTEIAVAGSLDQMYVLAAIIGTSAAGAAGGAIYMRSRRSQGVAVSTEESRKIDLNKILAQRPYLREDDKEAVKYIIEKGGSAFESEIRERFALPKATAWRLVKRLEREGLVEIKKTSGHNLIRIREQFANDQNSNG
jgi:uncharacterized membrane protein